MLAAVQLFDQDLVRLTFVVGIAVSVLVYERTHTTTGSLVVPGYIGAQLLDPVALLATGLNAYITYWLVSVLLPRYAAVYGRSRFVANIAVSILLSVLLGPVMGLITGPGIPVLDSIGYVIPALIAYDMNRQGVKVTSAAVMAAGAMAAIPALLLVLIDPGRIDALPVGDVGLFVVGQAWLPAIALVSTAISTSMFSAHGLRAGGFVGPMYLALAAVHPAQLLFFLALSVATYLVVHKGLKRIMIVFGRRKFAIMLMGGSLLSWAVISAVSSRYPDLLLISRLPITALFVPALLANDMERTSISEVMVGGVLAASATLSITVVAGGLVDESAIPLWAPLAMVVSLVALAWPRIGPRITRALQPPKLATEGPESEPEL